MRYLTLLWLALLLLASAQLAHADVLDFPDAGVFKGYTKSATYDTCLKDTTTFATPTDGGPFVTRTCIASSTTTLQQAFIADFNWPPTATASCTCTVGALSTTTDATTTKLYSLAVGCAVVGSGDSTAKTFGTEQSMTMTNVNPGTANATFISAVNGTAAAPNAVPVAGTPCQFRVVQKTGGTVADATLQHVRNMHCSCS